MLILLAIVGIGGLARFAALDRIPHGVYPDEAIMGVEGAQAVDSGKLQVFYPANNGREGLWVNLIGISVEVFGARPISLRVWSAIFGTLTIPGIFLLTRALFKWAGAGCAVSQSAPRSPCDAPKADTSVRPNRVALLAAFFLATSFWHINLSRLGFPAIMVPTLMTWSLYFLLEAGLSGPHGSSEYSALGGLLFGLGFHAYSAFRFAPVAVLAVLFLESGRRRSSDQTSPRRRRAIGFWLAGAIVAAAPILVHFSHHPGDFWGRANQVSVFTSSAPLRDLLVGMGKTALMFNVRGDGNQRHNIAYAPHLLPPVGILFLAGILGVLRLESYRSGDQRNTGARGSKPTFRPHLLAAALLSWLIALAAPAALTREGVPHALRAAGVLPPIMILVGIGADWCASRIESARHVAVFMLLIGLTGVADVGRYFLLWARDPRTDAAFNRDYSEIADFLNGLPEEVDRFVVVNARGVHVAHENPDGTRKSLPMPAQSVIYLTRGTKEATYMLPSDVPNYFFPRRSAIVFLEKDPTLLGLLAATYPDARSVSSGAFVAFLR